MLSLPWPCARAASRSSMIRALLSAVAATLSWVTSSAGPPVARTRV